MLEKIFSDDADPESIVEREGWLQISDPDELALVVDRILSANPEVVAAVRAGDVKQRGWLMGQVMRVSEGKASPEITGKILDKKLSVVV